MYDVTVRIKDPYLAPPAGVRGGYSNKIAATEAIQLLAGVSSLEQLDGVTNGRFSEFANNGRLRGAYGPRLREQLRRVSYQLDEDPESRQAVAVLWKPDDDLNVKDVPCTVSLTFRIVGGCLELKTHMRSNDVILGVPYDWFMFSRLQMVMAEVLGVPTGPYVHHVDNLHLYDQDEARAARFISDGLDLDFNGELGETILPAFSNRGSYRLTSWVQVQMLAMSILRGSDTAFRRFRWFYDNVKHLTEEDVTCRGCYYIVKAEDATFVAMDRYLCAECDHQAVPS